MDGYDRFFKNWQAVYSTHLPILLFSLFIELGNSEMEICLFQKPKRNGNRPNIYVRSQIVAQTQKE